MRGPIPGRAGLIVLAAAAVPIVISAARPLARAIGRGLSKIGDKLQEAAEEAGGAARAEAASTVEDAKEDAPPASASRANTQDSPREVEEATPTKKNGKTKARAKASPPKTKRKRIADAEGFETA